MSSSILERKIFRLFCACVQTCKGFSAFYSMNRPFADTQTDLTFAIPYMSANTFPPGVIGSIPHST